MSEVNAIPVVTCPEGRWRGDWSDGYAVLIKDLDTTKAGIYRTVLAVYYGESYVDTLSVDLLSSQSRQAFAVSMAARNGAHPVLWDGRLGHLYHNLQAAMGPEADGPPWPALAPLPGLLPDVPALPGAMLPTPLRAFAEDIALRMQVPLEFVAVPLLVTAGAIIGRQCGIFPKQRDDWLVVCNLWGSIIGRTSLMKSPACTQALKPLERLALRELDAAKVRATTEAVTREVLDAQIAGVKEALKKAAKSGNPDDCTRHATTLEALQRERDALDVPIRRFKTNDVTVAKLGERLRDNPTGLLLYRDELSGWLSSLRQEGREGDREFFLETWGGDGSYTFDRIGRGSVHVSGLCLSVVGGIQPGKLVRYVHETCEGGVGDDGLLQRFQLLVWPTHEAPFVNVDRDPDLDARRAVYHLYDRLAHLDTLGLGADATEEQTVPALHFAPEAQACFDAWRVDLETRVRAEGLKSPAFESHLAKFRSLMPSLALIFHLVQAGTAMALEGQVSLDDAKLAASWCEFLEVHARKVYAGVLHKDLQAAYALAEKIRSGAITDGQTVRDVYRNGWALLATPDDVYGGLRRLERHGWVRVNDQVTLKGGRPREVIQFNPALEAMLHG